MEKIRWGIAGPGFIANKFAQAIQNTDCASLSAVASRTEENGRMFAEKYGIPNVFCGYEAMAASDCIDAVYISTPHPFHITCAEPFIVAGKHVLCEKPLCVNSAQAIKLKKAADKAGVFLMEAVWTYFLPAIREVIEIVRKGEIGEIRGVEADFCYSIDESEDPKLFKNDMAGGSLLDVGVYGLHFASMLLGYEPVSISSQAHIENGVDLHSAVLMKYSNGAIASVSSAVKLYKPETAFIYGSGGYIRIPHFYGADSYEICSNGEERIVSKPFIGNGFEEEIIEACNCIISGKKESDILGLSKSIAVLKMMDEVRRQNGLVYPFDAE